MKKLSAVWTGILLSVLFLKTSGQAPVPDNNWIRPAGEKSSPVWGIKNGIVVGLWPASIEKGYAGGETGGPRGLLRIGYEFKGTIYLINYIAVEPLVDDDMEFSEVSPSSVDGKWGKLFWAADDTTNAIFSPYANAHGVISHPDKTHPEIEQLSWFVLMEKFLDSADPYLKLSIRNDKPGELCLEIFNHSKNSRMQRCALTATMGNYSKLRLLYLKNQIVDSRKIFSGYDDIEFIEKEPYAAHQLLRNKSGDFLAIASSNENLSDLSAWAEDSIHLSHWRWRYRPFYKLTQYWRVESQGLDSNSLQLRVNGRAKYWAGDSQNKKEYMDIMGGPAFENFEMRENYHAGQKFYFGLSLKSPEVLLKAFDQ